MAPRKQIDPFKQKEALTRLSDALRHLRTPEERLRFLQDLLTHQELEQAAKRFSIIECLSGGMTERQVANEIKRIWGKASTTTVSKAKQAWQGRDSRGGITIVLSRMSKRRGH